MSTNLLWFVMAGFLLGFATSTLWEWFYFRKERLKLTDRRIRELEAKLRDADSDEVSISPTNTPSPSPIPTVASVTGTPSRTSAWGDTPSPSAAYRSPGVFLESEEYEAAEGGNNAAIGRERQRAPLTNAPSATTPINPPTIQTVNSVTPNPPIATTSTSASVNAPDSAFAPRTEAREVQPTPADALRAKRTSAPRSRQEVLAALRRNSEAVQRGQFPLPEDEVAASEVPPPFASRASTLVSPTPPVEQEPPPYSPPSASLQQTSVQQTPTPTPTLSPARQRWVNNPALTQRSQEYPDDLSKIKGIGDVYKQRLYRAGIYTWKQIAEADIETLRRATSAYPSSNVDEWLVQAEKLMEKHGRKNAIYGGPQPDDMTKILGIGPVGASVLYRAGICTYEQLASTSIADLEALFPVAVAGDQPDFAQWVTRAAALADEKHGDK